LIERICPYFQRGNCLNGTRYENIHQIPGTPLSSDSCDSPLLCFGRLFEADQVRTYGRQFSLYYLSRSSSLRPQEPLCICRQAGLGLVSFDGQPFRLDVLIARHVLLQKSVSFSAWIATRSKRRLTCLLMIDPCSCPVQILHVVTASSVRSCTTVRSRLFVCCS
jgi:hypothetical protein